MRNKNDKTTLNKLELYLSNPTETNVTLTAKELEMYKRWDFIYDQLKACKTTTQVVRRVCDKFKISTSLAFKDIQHVNEHFRPLSHVDIEWLEIFIIEDAKKQIAIAQSTSPIDHKAWALARQTLEKIYNKRKDNDNTINPELYGNNVYLSLYNIDGKQHQIDWANIENIPPAHQKDTKDILRKIYFDESEEAQIINDEEQQEQQTETENK